MQNAIIALLIVFVVFQPVPACFFHIATLPGMSVLFVVAACTFYYNPLVGIVSLIAIYELLRRSGVIFLICLLNIFHLKKKGKRIDCYE